MRKEYVVRTVRGAETFREAEIDKLKSLGMVEFRGSTRINGGFRYNYVGRVR